MEVAAPVSWHDVVVVDHTTCSVCLGPIHADSIALTDGRNRPAPEGLFAAAHAEGAAAVTRPRRPPWIRPTGTRGTSLGWRPGRDPRAVRSRGSPPAPGRWRVSKRGAPPPRAGGRKNLPVRLWVNSVRTRPAYRSRRESASAREAKQAGGRVRRPPGPSERGGCTPEGPR